MSVVTLLPVALAFGEKPEFTELSSMAVRHHRRKRQMSEINVVPYIDVMLVLLVIFMVTAPLLMEGVQVDLPESAATTVSSTNSAI